MAGLAADAHGRAQGGRAISETCELVASLAKAAADLARRLEPHTVRVMEVCGTHTMAIFRAGLRSLLPANVELLSGPGCPVCVTPMGYVDAAIEIGAQHRAVVATFGDMMKVPGTERNLSLAKAQGADVRVVYSPLDALRLAEDQPGREVVFLGIGFETTAPLVAASVAEARRRGLSNFSVLCAHKLVPPALRALCGAGDLAIDAFLLPGHVSAIIGAGPYEFVAAEHGRACVIAGFEPADVMASVCMLLRQLVDGRPAVEIQYTRCVRPEGNPSAQRQMSDVFEASAAVWRGLGELPASGLALRESHAALDAWRRFGVEPRHAPDPPGCRCGDVICGRVTPPECPLFGTACTPMHAVGPCMVSSEGSCAAHFKYGRAPERVPRPS